VSTAIRILMLLAGILAAPAADAQRQLEFAGGSTHETNFESTYGWELDYAEGLSEHSYAMLGWLNEGHQENDHRDGLTAQIWAHTDFLDRQLSLAAGVGPYAYFDTYRDEAHPFYSPYTDAHGLTLIYSAELTWYMDQSWLTFLRANRLEAEGQVSTMLLLGLGYEFDGQSAPRPASTAAGTEPLKNWLTLYVGRTSLNSFVSESSTAYAIEYRRRLSRHVDWSVGWLDEGTNDIVHREGVTLQLWLVRPLLEHRLALGIGAGTYIAENQRDQTFSVAHHQVSSTPSDDQRVSGIVSVVATYRLDQHWLARLSFNRIVTNYDRDADVILLGTGYRF
jgi:hypothetical protein